MMSRIYILDYNSLYPHVVIGLNLFSPSITGYNGRGIIPPITVNDRDGIRGVYDRTPGKVEQTFHLMYNERVKLQKAGEYSKQLARKIILNTGYGLLGSKVHESVYNRTAAADCAAAARRINKHGRTVLESEGYEVLYGDTDSYIIVDPYDDKEKVITLAKKITDVQRRSFNVPVETHKLDLEKELKWVYFLRNDNGEFIKKCYIFVDENDQLTSKGTKIVKGDCSKFSVMLFNKYIKPKIMRGESIIFSAEEIYSMAVDEIEDNVDLLVKRYRVKEPEEYGSDTCIQYQISKRYGSGEIYLIPNRRIGAGKGKKKATVEELKEKYGSDWVKQVTVGSYVEELKHFIKPEERKLIEKLDKKRISKEEE